MARVLPCVPEGLEGAWIIDSVATLPEYRGLGLAGKLLESIVDRGRNWASVWLRSISISATPGPEAL